MSKPCPNDKVTQIPSGHDPLVDDLRARGVPVTRKTYLEYAYADRDWAIEPLTGEEREVLPYGLREERLL